MGRGVNEVEGKRGEKKAADLEVSRRPAITDRLPVKPTPSLLLESRLRKMEKKTVRKKEKESKQGEHVSFNRRYQRNSQ